MFNLEAKINPWKGLGGIELYSHISEFKRLLDESSAKAFILGRYLVRYEVKDQFFLWFNIINGKLFKITACEEYKGVLFDKIHIGMDIKKVLEIENSFTYDDFEEVYESSKGIFIETNPENNQVIWISVFIKELYDEDFENGKW
ncbi:hypothetical protein ACR6HW_08210 [Fusibacter sp. JL298sf-3]